MEKKDTVDLTHVDYDAAMLTRTMWRDVLGGTEALRAKHTTYLPQFPLETDKDYEDRWSAATLVNATSKTLEAFCGLVCQNEVTLGEDVPAEIVKLSENIDNKGNHINIVVRDVFERSFDGCCVILTDTPQAKANDLAEQQALDLRPYVIVYDAADVINWDYRVNEVTKKTELSLIVLRERKSIKGGQFLRTTQTQYLVYWLDEAGNVTWQRWAETKNKRGAIEHIPLTQPAIIEAQTAIPAAIVGKLSGKPPLRDLAYKNLEHAQTYSDYKTIIHKTCVPIPYTTGVDAEEFGKIVKMGNTMFHLPAEGSIGFAEVAGGSIDKTKNALDDIKQDMAMLGLAMLAGKPTQGDVTATETMLDSIQEMSALQVMAMQLKDALELTFGFMAKYLGIDSGGSITLGANWNQMVLSESELTMYSNMVADGNYPLEYLLLKLQEAGKLPDGKTADDALAAIDEEMKKIKPLTSVKMLEGQGMEEDDNASDV